jgi:hypothetical protein
VEQIEELFRANGSVDELEIDDEFRAHLADRGIYAEHRVRAIEVLEVHAGKPRYFLNASSPIHTRRAPLVMVGPTLAARFLCVPLEPTGRRGIWRPVTAFEASAHHKTKFLQGS